MILTIIGYQLSDGLEICDEGFAAKVQERDDAQDSMPCRLRSL